MLVRLLVEVDKFSVFPYKAPVTHSRFWLRLITIRPDETYIVKSGCIGMHRDGQNRKFKNPYDVSRRSYGISTTPLRFMTVLLRCYYGRVTT